MAKKLHTPGTYPAKVIDYGIWKSKAGLPMAAVMFEYALKESGSDRITWFGSFNGGAREFTVESLIRMGFAGKNGGELNKGKGSGVLDETKQFEIVIDNETYKGETNSKVKFINLPGGSGFREKMQDGEASVLMGGLNLEADFMQARQRIGQNQNTKVAPMAQAQQQQSFAADDDIPF